MGGAVSMHRYSRSIHSWLVSISSAHTSLRHDGSFGNTRTTRVLRFSSWFCRSSRFVVRIRLRCASGSAYTPRISSPCSSSNRATFGARFSSSRELEKRAPKVARLLEEHGEEILGVYALPEAHRKRMRTTNLLERQNQELKRRTRVVRVFPNEPSCLRLVCALLMETNQEWMERLYLCMDTAPPIATETTAAAAA